jgi:1L-myo-inositol 1-phosphate cytidylyltransferase
MSICRTDVVILAAGNGLRLSSLSPLPKPLVTVEQRPMLDRVFEAVAAANLAHVKIVVGHAADSIRQHPFPSADGLHIEWITNSRYSQPNGISLLCAERCVQAPFLLLMADHLFQVPTLERFLQQPCPADGALLAVDSKLDTIFDLPDATKVVTRASVLQDIGKHLNTYDAIDTGMFLCSDAIFDAMRQAASDGRESLSDGVRALCRAGRMRTWDVGPGTWIDVDTPAAREEAERMVRAGVLSSWRDAAGTALPAAAHLRPAVSSAAHRSDFAQRRAQFVPSDEGELVPGRG